MKISTKTRYGMRFMIDLAQHANEGCVALKDVAARQGISKKYLEQVVAPLTGAGLLRVTRGYAGGYELARPPEEITLADVVGASEDGLELLDCMSGLFACERQEGCLSQRIWGGLQQAMFDYLDGMTLADAAAETPSR
ncbi:Rrf2 family transcriptional regulator [Adlercreutzia sp. ZJ242]|uniref:RrF2 family transcriptional regulator n=1 Tax=Adlercreutzia sp. ZJ242 TaxID=2709409 RepID=UPI0013ED2DE8|nr:Rrf2 family transcriptional regulator [Adlercreutzia sp. ZJ242]